MGYSLAGLAILSWQAAVLALAIFAVTGVPIVARSIYLDAKQRRELRERLERRF